MSIFALLNSTKFLPCKCLSYSTFAMKTHRRLDMALIAPDSSCLADVCSFSPQNPWSGLGLCQMSIPGPSIRTCHLDCDDIPYWSYSNTSSLRPARDVPWDRLDIHLALMLLDPTVLRAPWSSAVAMYTS